jgi:ketosteroid isomerase-like protein
MKSKIPQAVAMILLATALQAQDMKPTGRGTGATPVRAQAEISAALENFLAHVEDPATHENWWADDLVYTGSSGKVTTKQEIVKSVREGAAKPKDPKETPSKFDAEDVKVSQFGDVAVLTFRLVQREGEKVNYYRNTGTLVKRDGRWQVVAWQATKAPEYKPEGDTKPTGKQ